MSTLSKSVAQIIFVSLLSAFVTTSFADDNIKLPASQGKVNFPHKLHIHLLKDCSKCHENKPGRIANLGKDWAHKTCKGCHTEMKKGPTACKGCHAG
jgi:hypothetical protein